MRLDIQGLRAIAVLAVMLFHAESRWLPGGFTGVDIFFVISGYLVGGQILQQLAAGQFHAGRFALARVRRILPACLLMLAVVALVAAILLTPGDFRFFRLSLQYASGFASNLYFAGFGDYFAPESDELPLLHTWSLAVEMQFYLLLPLLLWLGRRWLGILLPLLIAGLLGWSQYRLLQGDEAQYFSLLARVPEFLAGVWLVYLQQQRPGLTGGLLPGLAGVLLLVLGFVLCGEDSIPGVSALLPCAGAALLIFASRSPLTPLLAHPLLVWTGALSYSLYLWHWPVLALMRYCTGEYSLSVLQWLAFLLLTFGLAWLSWRFVEEPLRRSRGRALTVRSLALAGLVLAIALPAVALNARLLPALAVERIRYADKDRICHSQMVGECLRGDLQSGAPAALVLGDSHAAQLNLFFDEVGQRNGYAVQVISSSGCVPIEGFPLDDLREKARKPCQQQTAEVSRRLAQTRTLILAAKWQLELPRPGFRAALEQFIATSQARGQRVLVLAQIPTFTRNVLRLERLRALGLPLPQIAQTDWQASNAEVRSLLQRWPAVQFIDLTSLPSLQRAPYDAAGQLIYRDQYHLNEPGARQYGVEAAALLPLSLLR